MSELASPGQLRASFLRWALVLVPGIVLLGFLSGRVSASGANNPWFAELVKPELNLQVCLNLQNVARPMCPVERARCL